MAVRNELFKFEDIVLRRFIPTMYNYVESYNDERKLGVGIMLFSSQI